MEQISMRIMTYRNTWLNLVCNHAEYYLLVARLGT